MKINQNEGSVFVDALDKQVDLSKKRIEALIESSSDYLRGESRRSLKEEVYRAEKIAHLAEIVWEILQELKELPDKKAQAKKIAEKIINRESTALELSRPFGTKIYFLAAKQLGITEEEILGSMEELIKKAGLAN